MKKQRKLQQIHKEVNGFEFHGIMASCDLDTIIESQGFYVIERGSQVGT